MANGDLIKLGSLYVNNDIKIRPTNPWNGTPTGTPGAGNIYAFVAGNTIEIRDTDPSDENVLQWVEVTDGGKKLLVSDRVILVGASHNDLNTQGLILGKVISIDGKYYRVRSLTGGTNFRSGSTSNSGGSPTNNEWDRIIVNEGGFSGLPTPTSADLNAIYNATDYSGEHNQFWNWFRASSWTQEPYNYGSNRVQRGNSAAINFQNTTAASRSTSDGFRPVLEEIDMDGVVTLNNYSTAGNGGRKLVRLDNGCLVTVVVDSNTILRVFKSNDNGETWTNIRSIGYTKVNSVAISTDGINIAVVYGGNDSAVGSIIISENGTLLQGLIIDSSQTAVGNVTLAINPQGTKLMGAASTKNSSLPNSFNIRYYEAPINADGTVGTWTVEQVTSFNTSTTNHYNPTLSIDASGQPVVLSDLKSQTSYYIIASSPSISVNEGGTSPGNRWGSKVAFNGGTYVQSSPSTVTDKDGVIGNVWDGFDATHTSTRYIRFSKSLDGGVNWSVMQKLVPGINGTLTVDKANKYVITYEDAGTIKQITSTNKGDTWSSPVILGNGINPSSLYDGTFVGEFGESASTIYMDTQAGSVKYIGTYITTVLPILSVNIDGVNRAYDGGFVNINGEWKQIDSIFGNVNGVWKKSE